MSGHRHQTCPYAIRPWVQIRQDPLFVKYFFFLNIVYWLFFVLPCSYEFKISWIGNVAAYDFAQQYIYNLQSKYRKNCQYYRRIEYYLNLKSFCPFLPVGINGFSRTPSLQRRKKEQSTADLYARVDRSKKKRSLEDNNVSPPGHIEVSPLTSPTTDSSSINSNRTTAASTVIRVNPVSSR